MAALLYADNAVTRRPLGDTSALEVILHEGGLALDRAVLERALEEVENGRRAAAATPGDARSMRPIADSQGCNRPGRYRGGFDTFARSAFQGEAACSTS